MALWLQCHVSLGVAFESAKRHEQPRVADQTREAGNTRSAMALELWRPWLARAVLASRASEVGLASSQKAHHCVTMQRVPDEQFRRLRSKH